MWASLGFFTSFSRRGSSGLLCPLLVDSFHFSFSGLCVSSDFSMVLRL